MATSLPASLANPAKRALASADIKSLEDLTQFTESEVAELHGIGPKALGQLREAMERAGLEYKMK